LDEIQTNVLRDFLLAIHSHLYSFALRFIVLQTHATSYLFSSVTIHCRRRKGENLKENHTPIPMVEEIFTETSSLKTLKITSRNLNEIVRSCVRLLVSNKDNLQKSQPLRSYTIIFGLTIVRVSSEQILTWSAKRQFKKERCNV
jgi:hypothetical protein